MPAWQHTDVPVDVDFFLDPDVDLQIGLHRDAEQCGEIRPQCRGQRREATGRKWRGDGNENEAVERDGGGAECLDVDGQRIHGNGSTDVFYLGEQANQSVDVDTS